jgi:ABC-type branched-subunit amino acid transport system substrate-binding protein
MLKFRHLMILVLLAVVLAACSAETEQVEVTRLVEETVTEQIEVEVTRLVEETVTEQVEVEVTRVVEVAAEQPVAGRCAPTSVDDVEEILIGASAPLSKPGSVTGGLVMQAAFNIAVDDINDAGGVLGKPVNVTLYDTEGLPERGTAVAERLITQDCVVAIVGEYHSAVGLTMKEVSNKYHMPTIFAETYNDDITGVQYPEVFRIAPTSSFTAQMDAKWLVEVGDYNGDGEQFIVIVAENTGYGTGQVDKALTWFPQFDLGEPEVFLTEQTTQDFSSVAQRILALEHVPDAILIKVTGEQSYNLQQQLYEGGVDPVETIMVANQVALNHDEYWENVPDGAYAVVPRIGPWSSSASAVGLEFAEKYRAVMGRFPEAYAFEAYDTLILMADAINRAGSLDPDAIIAALEATDLEGAAGHYYFPYGIDNPPDAAGQPLYMWHQWPEVPLLFLQYTASDQSSDDIEVIWPETYRTTDGPIVAPGG